MKRTTTFLALSLTLLIAVACRQEQASVTATSETVSDTVTNAAAATQLTPEELGELGAAIKKEPARADELLAQKRLTRQTFEKAIRDVTENPEASKRYAEAYRKAGA